MPDVSVPEPWASALIARGMTDSRYSTADVPSLSRLSEETGIGVTTLSNLVFGRKQSKAETVAVVAEALGKPVSVVSQWANRARTVDAPYVPPPEVHELSAGEQEALSTLIRAIVASKKERGRGGNTAPMTAVTGRNQPDAPAGGPPGAGRAPAPPPGPDATGPGVAIGREEPSRRHAAGPTRGGGRR